MSPYTNFHAPRTSLSGRIQIGHKSGYYLFYYLFSVNIKPSRHRFGFSLAWDWQYTLQSNCRVYGKIIAILRSTEDALKRICHAIKDVSAIFSIIKVLKHTFVFKMEFCYLKILLFFLLFYSFMMKF